GTINYAGGTAPFVGTNLPIDFVSAPSSPILSIFGGALNFTTGSFLSSANFGLVFFDVFNGGGSFAITGAVPGAGIPTSTPLLTGSFAGPSTFTGSTFSGLPGAFSSILDVTFVDSTLTNFLNFPQSFGGGSVAQLEFNLTYASSAGPGVGFSGQQNAILVQVHAPEPTSLLLLGSGLASLGLFGRRKKVPGLKSSNRQQTLLSSLPR